MNRTSSDIYDELLVTRCQQRDPAAWDELVQRWNHRLLYYLRRLIDDEQEAASALQDVWLHVLRSLHALRDGARLAPWLYTIARRCAMTHFRRDYARREQQAPEAETVESDEGDALWLFDNAELVHFGLGKLGLAEREVLTLYFLEDLTLAEIAGLLGIPVGTVKSRLFKARGDLRRILERQCSRDER